ncbi:MAG TPA: allophanate hydrolase [Polyangiaceae bacterium]|nr:allophanate hydrolase [Polyangiaceae bacterium]
MNDLSPLALQSDYASGRRQPRDVLELVYSSIERSGSLPVWLALTPFEKALSALESAPRGPLFGVPFAVKDNIDVAGLPTTAACPEFSYMPTSNAEVVDRLLRAGAIVIGKTNLDQFATGLVGTRSPHGACSSVFDPAYISGGSSSGSAVAVASGQSSFALGTDTAGSGRIPAAFNGLVGLKPTQGLLSTRGVVPACRTLDCVSLFTHRVNDAQHLLELCAAHDPLDPFSRRAPALEVALPTRPRVGVPTPESLELFGDTESARLFEQAAARLERLGCELVPVDLRPFREAADLLYAGPWVAERLAAIREFFATHEDAVHPVVRSILQSARQYSAVDAFRGRYRLAALRRATEPTWETMDALVVPTAPTHYRIEEVLADPVALNQNLGTFTNFVNLLDLSALAVPAGFRQAGLPFGVTFIAPAFHDRALGELGQRFLDEAPRRKVGPPGGRVWLAVAGAHLSGQPLNPELTRRGARLIATTQTAPEYRLFALNTVPAKPGLVHAPGRTSHSIEVEVWELDEQAFGSFVANVPAPMTIGTTRLADGSTVKGFACEPHALEGADEISHLGGWRAFVGARSEQS